MRREIPVRGEYQERELREHCALVAVRLRVPTSDAFMLTAFGLDALQHRGEEGAGIAWHPALDGDIASTRGDGLRPQALPNNELLSLGPTSSIIGHTRYATSGARDVDKDRNRQPFVFRDFAIAHNGNDPTIPTQGYSRETPTSDTYAIGERIAQEDPNLPLSKRISRVLHTLNGAYMLTFLDSDGRIYIASDPWGFKPGVVGLLPDDAGAMFASETIALDKAGAQYIEKVERGRLYELTPDGIHELWRDPRTDQYPSASCSFESVYFQDPNSRDDRERSNRMVRQSLGVSIARRWQSKVGGAVDADLVIPVPNSGNDYALGLANHLNLPYNPAIGKNRYGGRNFIKPETPEQRVESALRSFGFDRAIIHGRKLIIVDDSIVRGFTTQGIIGALFELGAKEITLVSGMPPVTDPCHWGIDMSKHEELLFHKLGGREDPEGFPARVAEWLAPGKPLSVRFQDVNDYLSVIQRLDPNTTHFIETSGGCYHCVSGVVPLGVKTP